MNAPLLKLIPCPFCGGVPAFTAAQVKDDRRYVQMELECCITMTTNISYPHFTKMSPTDLDYHLKATLTAQWNQRADLGSDDPVKVELRDTLRELVHTQRKLIDVNAELTLYLLDKAPMEAVGVIMAADPVHGWHMKELKPWDEIGEGTQLYAKLPPKKT